MILPAELEPSLPPWSAVSPGRLQHIVRVATLVHRWAVGMGIEARERSRWLRAAWLHDALRDADEATFAQAAPDVRGPVELRHGPAAAAWAERDGETDRGILLAVRHHSVGWAGWDAVGQVLYCADFLEPGRTFAVEERARLADRFATEPSKVFQEVVGWRVSHMIHSGWAIPEATFLLWNSLATPRSGASR